MILWGFRGTLPPLHSCITIVCITCTLWVNISLHVSWSFYWMSYVCTSHTQIVYECNAYNIFSSYQWWWIGCHISFLRTSSWGSQNLSMSSPFLILCSFFTLLSFHITLLCLDLILVYWYTTISLFFYLFWFFHVLIFIFVVCAVTPYSGISLVFFVLVCDGFAT